MFRYVGQVASGAYGLLHIRDDEGQYGDHNVMYVLVLSQGQLVRRRDPFLTPLIPKTEGIDPDSSRQELSDYIQKYLPLGTIVALKTGGKKLMIFGRYQQDTANDQVFDYVGCPYPEGNITAKATFLFNHEDIGWIHYLGYADADDEAWVTNLKALPAAELESAQPST